jgi:hypothetical protein
MSLKDRMMLTMISSCANLACNAPFDYRQGQLFRFHKAHRVDEKPPNTHSVQHFWLCGNCSLEYTLLYTDKLGVLLCNRSEISAPPEECQIVAAA